MKVFFATLITSFVCIGCAGGDDVQVRSRWATQNAAIATPFADALTAECGGPQTNVTATPVATEIQPMLTAILTAIAHGRSGPPHCQ